MPSLVHDYVGDGILDIGPRYSTGTRGLVEADRYQLKEGNSAARRCRRERSGGEVRNWDDLVDAVRRCIEIRGYCVCCPKNVIDEYCRNIRHGWNEMTPVIGFVKSNRS